MAALCAIYPKGFGKGHIPKDWTHSFLKPFSKPGKDHRKLNGYRNLTMQNTIGKLMERIVAMKLARDLGDRKILPANQGGLQTGEMRIEKCSCICI